MSAYLYALIPYNGKTTSQTTGEEGMTIGYSQIEDLKNDES